MMTIMINDDDDDDDDDDIPWMLRQLLLSCWSYLLVFLLCGWTLSV